MGNTSSPAIANLGVRYAARKDPPANGRQWLIEDDLLDPYQLNRTRIPDDYERTLAQQFYVDDFLASAPTPEAALSLIDEGISRFRRYDLKLCKVQSNSDVIRKAYPSKDKIQTKVDLAPCDPLTSEPANGKSLGLQWDIIKDEFSIKTEFKDRPYTKRGFLGYIMSPYDPMGLASPALLSCKLLQREIFPQIDQNPHRLHTLGWDGPIPNSLQVNGRK